MSALDANLLSEIPCRGLLRDSLSEAHRVAALSRKFASTRRVYREALLAVDAELDELVRANVVNTMRYYRRLLCLAESGSRRRMHAQVDVPSLTRLDAARRRGRGVILVSAHLGEFDLAASWLAQVGGVEMVVPTDAVKSPTWQRVFDRSRVAAGLTLRPVGATSLARLEHDLSQHRVVAMMLDRRPRGATVNSRFFGRAASLSPAPGVLARRTGATILSAATSTVNGRCILEFGEPFNVDGRCEHRRSLRDLTELLAADLEEYIRRVPTQWHIPADAGQLPWGDARPSATETRGVAT